MSVQGADPMELERVAVAAERLGDHITSTVTALTATIAAVRWNGHDAAAFSTRWDRTVVATAAAAGSTMASVAAQLRSHAAQQVAASDDTTAADPHDVPGRPGVAGSPDPSAVVIAPGPSGVVGVVPAVEASGRSDPVRGLRYVPAPGVDPRRRFLEWDTTGDGLAIEVFGDPITAGRIGIWVPGVGTTIANFADPGTLAANRIWADDPDLAVIEWLGYDPPDTIAHAAVEMGRLAGSAGGELNRFVTALRARLPDGDSRTIILGGHSYGATVAANAAARGTSADMLVLAGAPGVPVGSVEALSLNGLPGTSSTVFVAANPLDPVRAGSLIDDLVDAAVHHAIGPAAIHPGDHTLWSTMHTDPTTAGFGATRLATGGAPVGATGGLGHLLGAIAGLHRYTDDGSSSLDSIRTVFTTAAVPTVPGTRHQRSS